MTPLALFAGAVLFWLAGTNDDDGRAAMLFAGAAFCWSFALVWWIVSL